VTAARVLHGDGSIGTDNKLFAGEDTMPAHKRGAGKRMHVDLLGEWRVVGEWGVNSHTDVLRLVRSQRPASPVL